jgi:uncharacterized protein with PIN domain
VPIAYVRCYGELNDFLQPSLRQSTLACTIGVRVSVKDLVEAIGVPHPEIDMLLINGEAATFERLVQDGDRIAAYPDFARLPVPREARVGPPPLIKPRFVADGHLGRLAAYLRLMGFDTLYRNSFTDHELVAVSAGEDRVLLTRDVGVLKHRAVLHGHWIRHVEPARQLVEVLRRYDLAATVAPFTCCLRCNWILETKEKSKVAHLLPERTHEHYVEFAQCNACGRVYWKGSHYRRMARLVSVALAVARARRDV